MTFAWDKIATADLQGGSVGSGRPTYDVNLQQAFAGRGRGTDEWQFTQNGTQYGAIPVYNPGSYSGADNYTGGDLSEYRVYRTLPDGGRSWMGAGKADRYNDQPYDRYDANGNYLGSSTFQEMGGGPTPGMAAAAFLAASGATLAGMGGAGGTGGLDFSQGFTDGGTAGGALDAGYAGGGLPAGGTGGGGLDFSQGFTDGGTAGGALDAQYATLNPSYGAAAGGAGTGGVGGAGGAGGSSLPSATLPAAATAGGGLLNSLAPFVGPAASLAGGLIASNAARDAASTQADATREAQNVLERIFNRTVELNEPFRQAGVDSVNALKLGMGMTPGTNSGWATRDFGMSDFDNDPGRQYRYDQANKALERSAAARGGALSGRAVQEAMRVNSDLASQEYGNSYNRYQINRGNKLDPLYRMAGYGQSATQTLSNAGQNYGNQQAGLITDRGAATAAGRVGSANALNSAIGQGVSMYMNNDLMNRLLSQR